MDKIDLIFDAAVILADVALLYWIWRSTRKKRG